MRLLEIKKLFDEANEAFYNGADNKVEILNALAKRFKDEGFVADETSKINIGPRTPLVQVARVLISRYLEEHDNQRMVSLGCTLIDAKRAFMADSYAYDLYVQAPRAAYVEPAEDKEEALGCVLTVEILHFSSIPGDTIQAFYNEFGYTLNCADPPKEVRAFDCTRLAPLLGLRNRLYVVGEVERICGPSPTNNYINRSKLALRLFCTAMVAEAEKGK